MKLFIQGYIENNLQRASYEYDAETHTWCAWVEELPGAYAQADTVEAVRDELAEVIEEYMLVSLYNKQLVPELERFAKSMDYDKAD